MLETVACFAVITALFEWMILAKLSPKTRVRVLRFPGCITLTACVLNLVIHWGTVVGSMTAVTAGLASIFITTVARWYWGYTMTANDGTLYYMPGQKKFTKEELK